MKASDRFVFKQIAVALHPWDLLNTDTITLSISRERFRMILPPQNVSLSKAVLMRKGGEDDEVKAGTLHA
jgi:hypothetical protein